MKQTKPEVNRYLLLPIVIGLIAGFLLAKTACDKPNAFEMVNPCPDCGDFVVKSTPITQKSTPATSPNAPKKAVSGKASYYSVEGCIGCNDNRIMANGQRLDDTRATVAYNHLPLNTLVEITNTDTGKTVTVPVTDRGGFERHGKIADLSLATKNILGCGDVCNITITK